MWIAIIILALINIAQWVVLEERMQVIEQMYSITLRKMWEFVTKEMTDDGDMRDLREGV